MKRTVVFDTETTGLIKNTRIPLNLQPKVIEFYGELINDETGEVLQEVEFLAQPGFKLEEIITRITGLSDHDLRDQPPFGANAYKVVDLLEQADRVVAHNLSYDRNMIAFEMRRINSGVKWPNEMVCTIAATEHIKGHRMNLSALHEHLFGEKFEGAHRAREDVKALTRCYLELRKRGMI